MLKAKAILKSRQGVAMVVVLSIIFVVAIFATALFTYSYNELNFLKKDIDIDRAQYLARTGVEAAIKAYPQAPAAIKEEGGSLVRLYLMEDGSHLMDTDPAYESENVEGYVDVEISHETEELNLYAGEGATAIPVVAFRALANVAGATQRAEAVTMASLDAYEAGWYNSAGAISTPAGSGTPPGDFEVSGILTGVSSMSLKGQGFLSGSVKAPAPSAGTRLTLPNNNSNNKIAWIAQNLSIDMPIDLSTSSNNTQKVLVLAGRNIELKGEITLHTGAYALMQQLGTLILNVPSDVAYIIDDEEYGKVFFQSDVYISVGRLFLSPVRYKAFSAGSAYYFRLESQNNLNGIDLLKYYTDTRGHVSSGNALVDILNNITGFYTNKKYVADDMIEITDMLEKVPPNPDTLTSVVWR